MESAQFVEQNLPSRNKKFNLKNLIQGGNCMNYKERQEIIAKSPIPLVI
jgi:hypothetical protein